ncbi:unnamed protein product [Diplocarpon coronariae]
MRRDEDGGAPALVSGFTGSRTPVPTQHHIGLAAVALPPEKPLAGKLDLAWLSLGAPWLGPGRWAIRRDARSSGEEVQWRWRWRWRWRWGEVGEAERSRAEPSGDERSRAVASSCTRRREAVIPGILVSGDADRREPHTHDDTAPHHANLLVSSSKRPVTTSRANQISRRAWLKARDVRYASPPITPFIRPVRGREHIPDSTRCDAARLLITSRGRLRTSLLPSQLCQIRLGRRYMAGHGQHAAGAGASASAGLESSRSPRKPDRLAIPAGSSGGTPGVGLMAKLLGLTSLATGSSRSDARAQNSARAHDCEVIPLDGRLLPIFTPLAAEDRRRLALLSEHTKM